MTTFYNNHGLVACIEKFSDTEYVLFTNRTKRKFKSFIEAAREAASRGYLYDCHPQCVLENAKRLAPRLKAFIDEVDSEKATRADEYLECVNEVIANFKIFLNDPNSMSAANEDLLYFKNFLKEHGF